MGLLDTIDEFQQPEQLTTSYFLNRPKQNGLATWYSYDSATAKGGLDLCGYTTYKIPIIKKKGPQTIGTTFVSVWDDKPIQIATIKFTYNFEDKAFFYSVNKAGHFFDHSQPVDIAIFKRDQWKIVCDLLGVDPTDLTPGQLYKDVSTINSFETIIDSIRSVLERGGFYLPNF